jgi:hypothetical protein
MIVFRIFLVLATIYLSWEILPFVFQILLYPFIAGGKNDWIFEATEWLSLLVGLFFAWGFWINTPENKKRRTVFPSAIVSILLLATVGFQFYHQQKQIMGYEPVEAAKNVILDHESEALVSSFDFIETNRWYPETSNPDRKIGPVVNYTVKSDSVIVYKVSVIQVNDEWWQMTYYQKIQN